MEEPIDYIFEVLQWVLFTPATLARYSRYKAVRSLGCLLCIPFFLTWYFTIVPVSLAIVILLIIQLIKDI
jgi:hypothetical protein